MMAQANNFGVTTTISIDGIGDILSSPVGPSASFQRNNNNVTLDGIQVAGSSSAIPFSPLSDDEIRRRARNNTILAKIQELEANSSIHTARSERLRMMREEYESLVRKYASNRRWNWGSASNGFLNGSGSTNGYTYLPRFNGASSQHQPLIPSFTNAPGSQLHQTSSVGSNENLIPHPTRDFPSNINRSFATKGVNTEITGPVRPVRHCSAENDLEETSIQAEGKKVKVILDKESQTENEKTVGHFGESGMMMVNSRYGLPQASSSSSAAAARGNFIFDGSEKPNQKAIEKGVEEIKEVSKKKIDMMMSMMLDDEEDDDESLLEKHERKRKLQLQEFYQQPKASARKLVEDNSGSIITSEEGTESKSRVNTNNDDNVTMSNTTDEGLLKLRQRQKLQQMREKTGVERLEMMLQRKKNEEIEDDEDSTFSFANDRKGAGAEYGVGGGGVGGLTDLSLSDSVSVFQRHEIQRKKLLERIGAPSSTKNEASWKGKSKPEADSDDENNADEDRDKSVIRSRKYIADEGEDDDDLDEPTTAGGGGGGATSESLGDSSFMDSIHKTPDTLPKEEPELHEIKEVTEEAKAEIKFSQKAPPALSTAYSKYEIDEVLVVTATAASNKALAKEEEKTSKPEPSFSTQSGVNDKLSEEKTEITLKRSNSKFEDEGYQRKRINDAEEICSNNLSSSKFDVQAERAEGISDANNTGSALQNSENMEEKETRSEFYENVEQERNEWVMQSENKIATEATMLENKDTALHSPAPSANMSGHSSSSSSFTTSASNVVPEEDGGRSNETKMHERNASKEEIQRESSTDSSSSSRQHSLDEQTRDVAATKKNEQTSERDDKLLERSQPEFEGESDAALQQNSTTTTTTLPQSMHKRHQQLQAQVRKKGDEDETSSPAGAEIMPEKISSPSSARKSASTTLDGTNVNGGEKTTKGSATFHQSTTNALSSPSSSKRTSSRAPGGDPGKGNGMTGGVSNIRSSTTRSFKSTGGSGSGGGLPPKQSAPTTTHVGPPGAQNTARRVRLKLNYDDSESDSSEIGAVKSGTENVTGNAMNVTGGRNSSAGQLNQKPTSSSINPNEEKNFESQKKGNSQKSVENPDDDFDDFFDI